MPPRAGQAASATIACPILRTAATLASNGAQSSASAIAAESGRSDAVRNDARTLAAISAGPMPLPIASASVTRMDPS